ncbi:hypothetical protein [Pseudoalteromonas phage PH357]|nr:hypothetical protein [Pseudoalteromonas phage PH357]
MRNLSAELIKLQNTLINTKSELKEAQNLLDHMESDPAAHFEDEMKESYNQMLDECYSEAFDSFPFNLGSPSEWIEENQPVDYRVGFSDYDFDYSNVSEYVEQQELVDQLESEVEDLEAEIEELQTGIDEIENN